MFFISTVTKSDFTEMGGHAFVVAINTDKATGINDRSFLADTGVGYRVIMLVPSQIDAVVGGYPELGIIL
jgi:hypothetical protein